MAGSVLLAGIVLSAVLAAWAEPLPRSRDSRGGKYATGGEPNFFLTLALDLFQKLYNPLTLAHISKIRNENRV